ncbi:MAG TPA: ribosome biogenesis GTPase Der [Leptospiraceae bacterium]|nr:ribosome biogenesis GTPase Der [Leptospiraceae bacterium]HMX33503.1 ribosome biogenesis GTPase Der [Leptospiraceae bacterium]HMY30292.1 ribosome biogenesis GTPase Der [Leptospiraceae bacterium]HMZ63645.1 ribosome biogenesis GTPase Der [Leptospiraceae bacterium]HNA08488.1 ribosome biogenesis GTPase Der [Leptospiraceae bacterium]
MKKLPVVSIVGRQNVGKSTLFNCFLKQKVAITHDFPGVTRDVLSHDIENENFIKPFTLSDTPGLDIENINDLTSSIIQISFEHLLESDIIVYVIDRNEILDYDSKLIKLFLTDKRFVKKNIICCVNKSDNPDNDFDLEYFYRLGLQEVIPISALGRRNLKILFDKINFYLAKVRMGEKQNTDFSICIVGKPNAGKSSFLNAILGYERAVVSEIPGTTRDTVHSVLKFEDMNILIVDTAGIRKNSKSSEELEFYSYKRTLQSIEDSDIVVHIIDASKGLGEYDKKIFAIIRKSGKPVVLAINKWDLIEDKDSNTFSEYKKDLISRFHPTAALPVISISAQKKQRIRKVLEECVKIHKKVNTKISTSKINQKLSEWMSEGKMGLQSKKLPRILYATQVSTTPFKLLLFVNHVDLFKKPLLSFIKNRITEEFQLNGVQVELEIRSDRKKEKDYRE